MATTWKYQQKNGSNQIILYNVNNPSEKKTISTSDDLALQYAPQYYTGTKATGGKLTPTGTMTASTIDMKDSVTGKVKTYKRNDPVVQQFASKYYILSDLQKESAATKAAEEAAALKAKTSTEVKQAANQNANQTLVGQNTAGFRNPQLMTTGPYAGKVQMLNSVSGADVYFSQDSSIVKQYAPSLYKAVPESAEGWGSGEAVFDYEGNILWDQIKDPTTGKQYLINSEKGKTLLGGKKLSANGFVGESTPQVKSKQQMELEATGVPAEDVKSFVQLYNSGGIPEEMFKEFKTTGQIPQGAWNLMQNAGITTTGNGGNAGNGGNNYSGDGGSGSGGNMDDINQWIDDAVASGAITAEQAALFKQTVAGWDQGKEVNMENILKTWQQIKDTTIDPYFKAEIDFQANQIQEAINAQNMAYEQQKEQDNALSGIAVRQAKDDLEKAGMTFTGKGIENLGAKSAFAVSEEGTSAIPTQSPFGNLFHEGLVNQQNRLLSSSSALKNKNNLQTIGQQAENQLGSTAAAKFGIPGYKITGGVVGQLPYAQQQAYGDLLSNLSGQQNQVNQYQNPLQFKF